MMLKAIQLSQFVRVEESIDKDALLAFRRTFLAAKDDEIGQITKRSWAALTECGAVKFVTGKEKFWFTPHTVEAPVVVAAGDEVAA
jgi:phage host-nuclease inhibitor protein Gam